MKRLTSFLVALLLATTALWAYDFQSGDLYYNILSESTVEVTYQVYASTANYAELTSVTIPATVANDGNTYTVSSIGESAFRTCQKLTSVVIPSGVTSISNLAFSKCNKLSKVQLPEGLTNIGNNAFSYCSALKYIDFPASITSIGTYAFYACSALTSVDVPASVTSLEHAVFCNCKALTSVTLHNGLTSIGLNAFQQCDGLVSITIPESVTSIGIGAFILCSNLASATLPKNLSSIANSMFAQCSSLTSIVIPESVTSIGKKAFSGCRLTTITIPENVTSIGEMAFGDNSSLAAIHVKAQTPPECGNGCFQSVPTDIPVYVPCGTKETYQASAGWSAFTNIIEPEPDYTATALSSNEECGTAVIVSHTCDNKLTVQATATNGHCHFTRWSDGSTQNPYTLVLTKDTTLTAEFALDQHTVTATAENGTVTGSGTYTHGTEVTLTATADEHYRFAQWSDGNTDNPRTIVVESDITLAAEFEEVPSTEYTVSIVVDAEQHGTVEVTVRAVPDAGFRFIQWNDGNTDNPRTILVTENIILRATFDIATNESAASSQEDTADTRKVLRDGNVYIQRGGKTYTIMGEDLPNPSKGGAQ